MRRFQGSIQGTRSFTEDTQRSTRERVKRLKAARWEPQKNAAIRNNALRAYKAGKSGPLCTFERLRGLYYFLLCKNLIVTGYYLSESGAN
jgi:hypothetical protein